MTKPKNNKPKLETPKPKQKPKPKLPPLIFPKNINQNKDIIEYSSDSGSDNYNII